MTDTDIILGGIPFYGHAVPNKINFGGKQKVTTQTLIGGQRVVDAMGAEPDDIKWSGRFRGADAIDNAVALDQMRKSGAAVPLTWFGFYFTVVVTSFTAETEKFYEVPYNITCLVVDDPSNALEAVLSSLDSLVGGDLTSATNAGVALGAAASAALTNLGTAVTNAGPLTGATTATLQTLSTAASTASTALTGAATAADPALDTSEPDGADPSVAAAWLSNTAAAMVTQASTVQTAAYVTRIGVNLALNQG